MHHGLIRLWPTGPSEEQQRDAIISAGALPDRIHVHDERPRKRNRIPDDPDRMTPLERAIHVLRPGDRLVIATAPVLGNNWEGIIRAIGWIEQRGAVVLDAETGEEVSGVAGGTAFADRAKRLLTLMRNGPGRRAVLENGIKTGPPRKDLGDRAGEILAMWKKPEEYTVNDVARAAKVSRVTLYKWFRDIPRRDDPVQQ